MIERLKAALAALHKNGKHLPVDFDYHFEAIEGLRSVIAEMEAQPKAELSKLNWSELVAWWESGGEQWDALQDVVKRMVQPKAEPVQEPVPAEVIRLAKVALHEMPRPATDWHGAAKIVCEAVAAHSIWRNTTDALMTKGNK